MLYELNSKDKKSKLLFQKRHKLSILTAKFSHNRNFLACACIDWMISVYNIKNIMEFWEKKFIIS